MRRKKKMKKMKNLFNFEKIAKGRMAIDEKYRPNFKKVYFVYNFDGVSLAIGKN